MSTTAVKATRKRSLRVGTVVAYVLLVLVGALCLVPFVWLIRSSFMTASQIFEVPPQWIPDPVDSSPTTAGP